MAAIVPITSRLRAPDEPFPLDLWLRFAGGYLQPFHKKNGSKLAGVLLDVIAAEAFERGAAPVTKAEALRCFAVHEAEDAEAALRLLEAQGLVEVAGDHIRVPARFRVRSD
jgi:hypothetical protein